MVRLEFLAEANVKAGQDKEHDNDSDEEEVAHKHLREFLPIHSQPRWSALFCSVLFPRDFFRRPSCIGPLASGLAAKVRPYFLQLSEQRGGDSRESAVHESKFAGICHGG